MNKNEIPYLSSELELFENVVNWKKYFSSAFRTYVKGNVLEIGAGIGSNIPFFINNYVLSYTCIEPDFKQAEIIRDKISLGILPNICIVKNGILEANYEEKYNTILYIDVIEHIEDDEYELLKAYDALEVGGFLCVLVPANPMDYSLFDKTIGHYRRYSKQTLLSVLSPKMDIVWCRYLDSLGALSSKMNKYFLKQTYPKLQQVIFWDSFLIPVSKLVDPLLGYKFGKSLLLVVRK